MAITSDQKMEIVAAFQRSLSQDNHDEINAISLKDLKQADAMLGNRDINAGFRIAMQNKIKELEGNATLTEQRSYESKIRALNLVTGIILGLIIAGIAKWLWG